MGARLVVWGQSCLLTRSPPCTCCARVEQPRSSARPCGPPRAGERRLLFDGAALRRRCPWRAEPGRRSLDPRGWCAWSLPADSAGGRRASVVVPEGLLFAPRNGTWSCVAVSRAGLRGRLASSAFRPTLASDGDPAVQAPPGRPDPVCSSSGARRQARTTSASPTDLQRCRPCSSASRRSRGLEPAAAAVGAALAGLAAKAERIAAPHDLSRRPIVVRLAKRRTRAGDAAAVDRAARRRFAERRRARGPSDSVGERVGELARSREHTRHG